MTTKVRTRILVLLGMSVLLSASHCPDSVLHITVIRAKKCNFGKLDRDKVTTKNYSYKKRTTPQFFSRYESCKPSSFIDVYENDVVSKTIGVYLDGDKCSLVIGSANFLFNEITEEQLRQEKMDNQQKELIDWMTTEEVLVDPKLAFHAVMENDEETINNLCNSIHTH